MENSSINSYEKENNNIELFNNDSSFDNFLYKNIDEYNMIKDKNMYSRRSSFSILSSDSNNISSFSIIITSNYNRKNTATHIKEKKKSKYIFCVKCNNFYTLDFNNYIINFECNCFKKFNYTIDNFIHDFTITDKDKVEKYSKCKIHNNKKYKFYCKECKCDLCDECLNETTEVQA